MHTKALPYVFLLSLFWGTNVVASRFGIGEFNPYLFITLRLTIAILFFIPVLLFIQGKLPTRRSLWAKAALPCQPLSSLCSTNQVVLLVFT